MKGTMNGLKYLVMITTIIVSVGCELDPSNGDGGDPEPIIEPSMKSLASLWTGSVDEHIYTLDLTQLNFIGVFEVVIAQDGTEVCRTNATASGDETGARLSQVIEETPGFETTASLGNADIGDVPVGLSCADFLSAQVEVVPEGLQIFVNGDFTSYYLFQ